MKKLFTLVLLIVTPLCHGDTVTFNLPFNQLFGKKSTQPDDSDLAFLAPQTASYQDCLSALTKVPVIANGEKELNATWSSACDKPFQENYKNLFSECDQQRLNNRQWGQQTRQFISLLSSCEGETAEKRRSMFSSSVQMARTQREQVFQRIDAINEQIRIAERQAKEEEMRVLAAKQEKEHARLRNEMYRAFEAGGSYAHFSSVQQLYSCGKNGSYTTVRGNIFQVLERTLNNDSDCCALSKVDKKNRNLVVLNKFDWHDALVDLEQGKVSLSDALARASYYAIATTPSACPKN